MMHRVQEKVRRLILCVVLIVFSFLPSSFPVMADDNAGLAAYYPFKSNANDESGNSNNGTIYGGAGFTSTGGNAPELKLDGVNDYVGIGNQIGNGYQALTVEAWIKPEELPTSGNHIRKYIVSADDVDSNVNNSVFNLDIEHFSSLSNIPRSYLGMNIIFGVRAVGQPYIHTAIAMTDASYWYEYNYGMAIRNNYPGLVNGQWLHLAGVYDGRSTKLYLNGQLDVTSDRQPDGVNRSVSGPLTTSTLPRRIGVSSYQIPTSGFFKGLIDEVRIYGRALSPEEVLKHYEGDDTVPVITPVITGMLGNDGWYTSDVTVSWSVIDEESEVTSTGCETTVITQDTSGVTLTCEATSDGGTNSVSVTVKRDATAPVITILTPADGDEYITGEVISADWNASDAMSGLANASAGTIDTATTGEKSFTVTAIDIAGNATVASRNYYVLSVSEAIDQLIAKVKSLNLDRRGSENSLLVKLNAAKASLERGQENTAVNQINAFINEVRAQSGKKVAVSDADDLISRAARIIAAIQ